MQWREAVFGWATNPRAWAIAGDDIATGAADTLGRTLYRSFDLAKKEVVKKSVRTREIVLVAEHDQNVVDQMKVLS